MGTLVTAADSVPGPGPAVQPAVPTAVISDLLGRITRLRLPGAALRRRRPRAAGPTVQEQHQGLGPRPPAESPGHHLRGLQGRAQRREPARGARALRPGVVNALQGAGAKTYTLEAFRRKLRQEVLDLSERLQEADAYFPDDVDPRALFGRP